MDSVALIKGCVYVHGLVEGMGIDLIIRHIICLYEILKQNYVKDGILGPLMCLKRGENLQKKKIFVVILRIKLSNYLHRTLGFHSTTQLAAVKS